MWVCPKCGRSFKNTNQDHYCGSPPEDINAYINGKDEEKRKRLCELVMLIRSISPAPKEMIKWSMPSFQGDRGSMEISAGKTSISLYVGENVISKFIDRLDGLKYKKDALYLPYKGTIPYATIKEMIEFALHGEE